MKTAFLFPGQGSQTLGMGTDLYHSYTVYKNTFDLCEQGADLDLKAACFEGRGMEQGETLQPAIFAHSLALYALLQSYGAVADIFAGLSLGEYTALCAAGCLDAAQGAALVRARGRIMDTALPAGSGGMLSIIGFSAEQVEERLTPYPDACIANHLSQQQTVVAGRMETLTALRSLFEQAGAKMTTLLDVRGPSHSPLLAGAAKEFSRALSGVSFLPPQKPVYSNVLARPYPPQGDTAALLTRQLCERVRWHESMERMLSDSVTTFVEVGPGNVLFKLIKRRAGKDAVCTGVRDGDSLNKYLETVRNDHA